MVEIIEVLLIAGHETRGLTGMTFVLHTVVQEVH